jgi:response regulator RpfG family c-di-GMP phosphodiesterase
LPKVIAMVNGTDDRNLYQKGTDLGVGTYLVRPFAASILQERIEKEMNQRIL